MPDIFNYELTIEGEGAADFVTQLWNSGDPSIEQGSEARTIYTHAKWFVILDLDWSRGDPDKGDWAFLSGYTAWDTIEEWTKTQREEHPELDFAGLIQSWDGF